MFDQLANVSMEFPIKPDEMFIMIFVAIGRSLLLILSFMPWWFWLVIGVVIVCRLYQGLARLTAPVELRPRRRRRHF